MNYFFIAGNVASIAAFVGLLLQLSGRANSEIYSSITYGAVIATGIFWLYFYFSPSNRLSAAIDRRLDHSGTYRDSSSQAVEVAEGEFEVKDFGSLVIAIPPFENAPEITVYTPVGRGVRHPPSVSNVTRDAFTISVLSTSAYGKWRYRARGKALTPEAGDA